MSVPACLVEESGSDMYSIKARRDFARRVAVPLIIRIDGLQCGRRFVHGRETKHPLAVRQPGARAGVLDHDGLPAGQITQRSIADPRVLEFHARRLCTTELATRSLDIGAVLLRAARYLSRMSNPPAVALQARSIVRILIDQIQRELERLGRVAGEIQELKKGHPLRVLSQ